MPPVPSPTPGQQVFYQARGSADGVFPPVERVAFITEVSPGDRNGTVGLIVFNPKGLFFHSLSDGGTVYDADRAPGTWAWPEWV